MRIQLYAILFLATAFSQVSLAQGGTWIWMNGSDSVNPSAVYGAVGVPAPGNVPQGFYESCNWTDEQGNFWVFAGVDSLFAVTNDFWMYNPQSNLWTWIAGPGGTENVAGVYGIQGVPSARNYPGARGWGSISWTDTSGALWLFGGFGVDAQGLLGCLNDLWRYDITTSEWTWLSGSDSVNPIDVYGVFGQPSDSATPGGRQECSSSWVDNNGNLWLFGGMDIDLFANNDMWRFDLSINEWALMKGPGGGLNHGNYGVLGVENDSNLPPPRGTYTRWKDASGNFYIWGGIRNFSPGQVYSDVWRFNTITNNWTWVAGDSTGDSLGNYQNYCTDNGYTGPMQRGENRTAQVLSCANAFLTFGGFQFYPVNPDSSYTLNDLWLFNTQTSEWKWLSGSNMYNDPGRYGALGVAAASNLPTARFGPCLFMDNSGSLWVFGGQSCDSKLFNDMWKFVPDNTCLGVSLLGGIGYQLSSTNFCRGDSALLTIDSSVLNVQITPSLNFYWLNSNQAVLYPDTNSTYLITGQSLCNSNDSARITFNVTQPGVLNYILSDTAFCMGNLASVAITGSSGVQLFPSASVAWQDSDIALLNPDTTTVYTLIAPLVCRSNDTVSFTLTVNPPPQLAIQANPTSICAGDSAQLCATSGLVSYGWNNAATTSCITVRLSGEYDVTATDQNGCTAQANPVNIVVHPEPMVTITPDTDAICTGDSVLICANGGFAIYDWNTSANTICIEVMQTGGYYVTAIDSNNCTATSNQVGIVVHPLPSVSVEAIPDSICEGDSALLCATEGFINYLWNTAQTSICFTTGQAGSYAVSVTDQYNCTAASSPVDLIVHQPPIVDIVTDSGSICSNDSAQLCTTSAFASYNWNNGETTPCIYANEEGNYYVSVSDQYNCTAVSNQLFITVRPVQPILISISSDTLTVYSGQVIQWYFNGNAIPGAGLQYCIEEAPGEYSVTVADTNGCEATSSVVLISTSIAGLAGDEIKIYPNPLSSGNWQLEVSSDMLPGLIEMFDDNGRLVYKSEIESRHTEFSPDIASGIYLLRVSSSTSDFIVKLVKI